MEQVEYSLSPASGEAASTLSYISSGNGTPGVVPGEDHQQPHPPPAKKKRNQPGMPDPDAEVISLSPKSLLATNRFVCEICGKGFQRDQNLQLHRRGHNLPWKLRQRNPKEAVRKRVYVCPETSCVHHDPRRALGDLTGIKKHFCRKHGEKKWKCERCSKKYAVQSDWKAHLKTCGTREYKCDCGTIFSRRDSFVTHRAFCDALALESAKVQSLSGEPAPGSPPPASAILSPVLSTSQSSEMQESTIGVSTISTPCITTSTSNCYNGNESNSIILDNTMFAPLLGIPEQSISQPLTSFPSVITSLPPLDRPTVYSPEPPQSLSLSPIYQFPSQQDHPDHHQLSGPMLEPAISATALLQRATQMGAKASGSSLLCGFTLSQTPLNHPEQEGKILKSENGSLGLNVLGLGLPTSGEFGDPSGFFGSKPTTLDFLGLGIGLESSSDNGTLPGYLTSIGSALDMAAEFGEEGSDLQLQGSWDNDQVAERKPRETVL